SLEGIGYASLADRGDVFFINYLMAAREMEPGPENPLRGMGLQTNVVSQPLRSFDGSRHLFRLIAAEPDQPPRDLDQVRDQVVADARRQRAFDRLAEQQDQWKARASEVGLDSLADEMGVPVLDLPQVTRTGPDERTAPNLPGIGQSPAFVAAVYEAADALAGGETPIAELP